MRSLLNNLRIKELRIKDFNFKLVLKGGVETKAGGKARGGGYSRPTPYPKKIQKKYSIFYLGA